MERGRQRRQSARARARGLTLIEILITIALIALMSGTLMFGTGMLQSSRLRAGATVVLSAVRLAATRANQTGRPARIVFDIDERSIWIEESMGARMLRDRDDAETAGAEAATPAEEAARAESDRILEGPRAPRPRFQMVKALRPSESDAEQGHALEPGIRIVEVQTEHDEVPRVNGRAYLYFWPGGRTENAVVQLSRGEDDGFLSVRVSALTGRAKIEPGRVELPPSIVDGDYSEREEP
jgi:general secretion pathway protein H